MTEDTREWWMELYIPCWRTEVNKIKAFYMAWLSEREILASIGERKKNFFRREVVIRVSMIGDTNEEAVEKMRALHTSMNDYPAFLKEHGIY